MREEQKFFRVERTDGPVLLIAKASKDPEAEARKGGDVVAIEELTAEQAAAFRAARPVPTKPAIEAARAASKDGNPLFAEAITYIENALRAMVARQDALERMTTETAHEAGRVRFDMMRHGEAIDVLDDAAPDVSAYPLLASTCPPNVALADHARAILAGNLAWAEGFLKAQ